MNLSLGMPVPKKLRNGWLTATDDAARAKIEQQIMKSVLLNLESYKSALDTARGRGVILCKAAGNQMLPARFDGLCYSRRRDHGRSDEPSEPASLVLELRLVHHRLVPGQRIYSAVENPNVYDYLNGTSMATPYVSGLVALMKTLNPDLTFEEARDILIATGENLPDLDRPIGPLVNARAAVEEVVRRLAEGLPPPSPEPPLIPQPPDGPKKPTKPPSGPDILNGPEPWKHPEVQRLIDLWLSIAIPPIDEPKGPWTYDKYGRAINPRYMDNSMPPDWAGYRHRFTWERARRFDSTNHGTLYDFVARRLAGG